MHLLKSLMAKIGIPTILSAALLTTALSHTGTSQTQNTTSKKTHMTNSPSAASRLSTYASGIKDTVVNGAINALDAIDTDTIQNLIKTGWTAARLIGIAGCFKLAHEHKEETFTRNILKDHTYADYALFGTYFTVAGIIAQNIYKSYETSIKEFFEEEDGEENGYEENESEESENKNS